MLVAHAGHWAVGILYAIPVFAVLIALWISMRRERRRQAEEGEAAPAPTTPGSDAPGEGGSAEPS
jgi:hypothetical protein